MVSLQTEFYKLRLKNSVYSPSTILGEKIQIIYWVMGTWDWGATAWFCWGVDVDKDKECGAVVYEVPAVYPARPASGGTLLPPRRWACLPPSISLSSETEEEKLLASRVRGFGLVVPGLSRPAAVTVRVLEAPVFADFSLSVVFSFAAGLSTKSKHVHRPRFSGSVVSTLTILNLFLKSCWLGCPVTGTSLK